MPPPYQGQYQQYQQPGYQYDAYQQPVYPQQGFPQHGYGGYPQQPAGTTKATPAAATPLEPPAILPAAPGRAEAGAPLPDTVDVLIVGSGPAGLALAAQLAAFPEITTRIVERREGPMDKGQADGISCRSMEMFQAFGFAHTVKEQGYWVNEATFWKADPADPARLVRNDAPPLVAIRSVTAERYPSIVSGSRLPSWPRPLSESHRLSKPSRSTSSAVAATSVDGES